MLTDQLLIAVTEQGLDAFVDKRKAPLLIQHVDDIRRVVDDKTMQSFRAFEFFLNLVVAVLGLDLGDLVGDGFHQIGG